MSYAQFGKDVTYTCPVRVPAVVLDSGAPESDDAGADTLSSDAGAPDAGALAPFTRPENLVCTAATAGDSPVIGRIGRTIHLTFDDTPVDVHVSVREAGETIFDQTLDLSYETTYPTGPSCGAALGASRRIDLRR